MKTRTMTTPVQIQQIRESDPKDSARVVGERVGVDEKVVSYYRIKWRKEANGGKPAAKKTASKKPAKDTAAGFEPEPDPTEPEDEPETFSVTIPITAKALDAWWLALSTDFKTSIFECNLLLSSPDAQ